MLLIKMKPRVRRPAVGLHQLRGVSLIEVLVSIVISSIGLLALAGVNAAAMRYTKMSQYRATATQLANDMGERMRANKGTVAAGDGFLGGGYDFITDFAGQATKAALPGGPGTHAACDLAATTCSSAEIAALDLAQWRRLVRDQLPEGSVFLKRSATETAMDLWVVWRDPAVVNEDEAPALVAECIDDLNLSSDKSIRCSYFRINL